jgi:integrase
MATLKPTIRNARADGFHTVYIRVTHRRQIGYIKTDKVVTKKELTKNNEIKDPFVLQYCSQKIIEYMDALNKQDISNWNISEVISYLLNGDEDVCFSDYARLHIKRMINKGQERNAKNYKLALQHFERFCATDKIMFSQLTSQLINKWIKSMSLTHRAKEMYPICMRQVFRVAQLEFNDYDRGILKIKTNPWIKVSIPSADKSEKLAISPESCREFFAFPVPESKMKSPLSEFGRDVAMMIICLAGINTIDLFGLQKKDYKNGILSYQRAKTRSKRNDGAYIEMRVPPILQPIIEKYLDNTNSEYLFNFHQRLTNADSFNANVNIGIKQICKAMGLPKEQWYSAYTFRHTWGTIAQNDIKATLDEVAFAMNHSTHRVTRGYIKIDFTPAWELNEKVVDFIFFSDKVSARESKHEESHFRLSYRYMINASAYHQGKMVAELTDVGFNNVDEVINRLVTMLPTDIPERAVVLFKIVNLDKDQVVVYQKQKGKGF